MPITNELLSNLIQCRYRVYLKLAERTGQNPEREALREQLLRDYCARAREQPKEKFTTSRSWTN